MILPRVKTLSNGLRVLTIPMPQTKALTALVLVRTGSRYETPRINGVSHFLEHMMFKGTERRPATLDITRELDGVGAEFNAFTGKDHTGFYVKADAGHSTLALDILSDILLHSLFPKEEVEKERTVIVEEINMYEDNPMMSIDDEFEKLLFHSSSLGWLVSGTRKNILKDIAQSDIVRHYGQWYQPKNMLVVLSGSIAPGLDRIARRVFTPLRPSTALGRPFRSWNGVLGRDRVRIKWKETEQVHVGLGAPSYPHRHKKLPALKALLVILGGNMSSRLFISVREKRGLAYMIRAGQTAYQDTGEIMIHAGLDKSRIEEALRVILEELTALCNTGVTDEELMRAKEYLAGQMALQLEDSSAVAQWYGRQHILLRSAEHPEQALKNIRRVTSRQVQEVARELFTPSRLHLAVIGPYKSPKPFKKILSGTN